MKKEEIQKERWVDSFRIVFQFQFHGFCFAGFAFLLFLHFNFGKPSTLNSGRAAIQLQEAGTARVQPY